MKILRAFLAVAVALLFCAASCEPIIVKVEGKRDARGLETAPNTVHGEADMLHGEIHPGAVEGHATGTVSVQAPVEDGAIRVSAPIIPTTTFSPTANVEIDPGGGCIQSDAVRIETAPDTVHVQMEWKPSATVNFPPGAVQVHLDFGQLGVALSVAIMVVAGVFLVCGLALAHRIARR